MSTELYKAVVWEVRKAIQARGLTMDDCDRLSGTQDGYSAKMLHPETKSGREAGWETLEYLVRAVFPDGFRIRFGSIKRPLLKAMSTQEKALLRGTAGRLPLKDLAAFAGRRGGVARLRTMTVQQRKASARKAARARWRQFREAPAP